MGAAAVRDGADCLIIDAESEYEGKYVAAQSYLTRLRRLIGYHYPARPGRLPLRRLPPCLPLFGVPRTGWRPVQRAPDVLARHRHHHRRGIRPHLRLQRASTSGRFIPWARSTARRRCVRSSASASFSRAYGAPGVSWWDWQEANPADLARALAPGRPAGRLRRRDGHGQHRQGRDRAIWSSGPRSTLSPPASNVGVDGGFGANTRAGGAAAFRPPTGSARTASSGPQTWIALLRYRDARIVWSTRHGARLGVAHAALLGSGPVRVAAVPKSASRPARRNEIASAGGRGGVPRALDARDALRSGRARACRPPAPPVRSAGSSAGCAPGGTRRCAR